VNKTQKRLKALYQQHFSHNTVVHKPKIEPPVLNFRSIVLPKPNPDSPEPKPHEGTLQHTDISASNLNSLSASQRSNQILFADKRIGIETEQLNSVESNEIEIHEQARVSKLSFKHRPLETI
jgi:hypothetical protein